MKVESLDDIVARAECYANWAASWQSRAWNKALRWCRNTPSDLPVYANWVNVEINANTEQDEGKHREMWRQLDRLYPKKECGGTPGDETYNRARLIRCLERLASGEDV